MARPKKIIEAIKKVITPVKKEVVTPQVALKFDPSIPENKQRHLR
jgi:hypothetical protein